MVTTKQLIGYIADTIAESLKKFSLIDKIILFSIFGICIVLYKLIKRLILSLTFFKKI